MNMEVLAPKKLSREVISAHRDFIGKANTILEERENGLKTRVEVFRELCSRVPTSELGLPAYLYRIDLIPGDFDTYEPDQKAAILQAASIGIDLDDGIPRLDTGAVLWDKFPWESDSAYEYFHRYVDMPNLQSSVNEPSAESERAKIQISIRDIRVLAELYRQAPGALDVATIQEFAVSYNWQVRVKAYDLYIAAAYRKYREREQYSVETQHYRMAGKLLAKANDELVRRLESEDLRTDMKERDLIDLVKSMTQIQRVSIGLSTGQGKNDVESETPRNASLELTLRTIAKNAGEQAKEIQDDDRIQAILEDPEALIQAQELIIKLNRK
jgi:hypothetical protein